MKIVIAAIILTYIGAIAQADELNDMPELACARASTALEREQIGCRDANLPNMADRRGASPLDRSEED